MYWISITNCKEPIFKQNSSNNCNTNFTKEKTQTNENIQTIMPLGYCLRSSSYQVVNTASWAKRFVRGLQLWCRMWYWTWMPYFRNYYRWTRRGHSRNVPTYIWLVGWPMYGALVTWMWCRAWMSRANTLEWSLHMSITGTKIKRVERCCDSLF